MGGVSPNLKKMMEVAGVCSFAAFQCVENEEVFVDSIENAVKNSTGHNLKHLKSVLSGTPAADYVLNVFIKSEICFVYRSMSAMSLQDFRKIIVKNNQNSAHQVPSAKMVQSVKRPKAETAQPIPKKRSKFSGTSIDKKVSNALEKISGEFNGGIPIQHRLEKILPSSTQLSRWKFECGISGCKKKQSIAVQSNNRIKIESYKHHLNLKHSPKSPGSSDLNESFVEKQVITFNYFRNFHEF